MKQPMAAAVRQPNNQQYSYAPQLYGNQSNDYMMPQGYGSRNDVSLDGVGGQGAAYPGGQMGYSGGNLLSGNFWDDRTKY